MQNAALRIAAGLDATACASAAGLPPGTRSLLLLSPDEPAFWPVFTAAPEWLDGAPDPMDRWSRRVIGTLAERCHATALFPFGGPPWAPFLDWARASGRIHASPVGMLVSRAGGLFTSFRGALAFDRDLPVPAADATPCRSCAAPCTATCPVAALGPGGYDVARCKAHLRHPEGRACLEGGCLARRACPAAPPGQRLSAHSAYHMAQFLGAPHLEAR
ncbi:MULTISPECIES: ferredoxin [Pseudooceanicola]|uniref:ferredoxin n=1 Tax=Pseudooceanicola TaxID=1679449 RepID=UPI001EEF9C1D|nr:MULTISPECIES: ferredoxin [Pseudooceanicola]